MNWKKALIAGLGLMTVAAMYTTERYEGTIKDVESALIVITRAQKIIDLEQWGNCLEQCAGRLSIGLRSHWSNGDRGNLYWSASPERGVYLSYGLVWDENIRYRSLIDFPPNYRKR